MYDINTFYEELKKSEIISNFIKTIEKNKKNDIKLIIYKNKINKDLEIAL